MKTAYFTSDSKEIHQFFEYVDGDTIIQNNLSEENTKYTVSVSVPTGHNLEQVVRGLEKIVTLMKENPRSVGREWVFFEPDKTCESKS
jgi:hypothetical protein